MKNNLNNYTTAEDESSASNEIKNFVQMIARVESNDGAVLRKLISTAAYKEELFAELEKKNQEHQDEIRSVCSSNYRDFVSSTQRLIRIGSNVKQINKKLEELYSATDKAIDEIQNDENEIKARKRVQYQVGQHSKDIILCRRAIQLVHRSNINMEEHKFFRAIKYAEMVEKKIPALDQIPSLQQQLVHWLSAFRDDIQKKCLELVTNWFITMRSEAKTIGKAELAACQELVYATKDSHGIEKSSILNAIATVQYQEQPLVKDMQGMQKKLQPLLQAMHIFKHLKLMPKLAKFYREHRGPQLYLQNIIPDEISSLTVARFLEQYPDWNAQCIGTFAIESLVVRYTEGTFFDTNQLHAVFQKTQDQLISLYNVMLRDPNTSSVAIVALKDHVLQCYTCLRSGVYQYDTSPLLTLFQDFGPTFLIQYEQEQTKHLADITTREMLLPIRLEECPEKVQDVLELKGYVIDGDRNFILPCAKCNVSFTSVLLETIQTCAKYARNLNVQWTSQIHILVQSLLRSIQRAMSAFLDTHEDLHMTQMVQLAVNCTCFQQCFSTLEHEIDGTRGHPSQVVTTSIWHARPPLPPPRVLFEDSSTASWSKHLREVFNTTSHEALEAIGRVMVHKINDLLSSLPLEIQWTPSTRALRAHDSILDLVQYLDVTWTCLEVLPASSKDHVHFSSCDHISQALTSTLSNAEHINRNGLVRYEKSVKALVEFAQRCDVHDLASCFRPLERLLAFLLSDLAIIEPINNDDRTSGVWGKYAEVEDKAIVPTLLGKYVDELAPAWQAMAVKKSVGHHCLPLAGFSATLLPPLNQIPKCSPFSSSSKKDKSPEKDKRTKRAFLKAQKIHSALKQFRKKSPAADDRNIPKV